MSSYQGAQIDDNNFINNTFSFLDELDNNNDDFIDLDKPSINSYNKLSNSILSTEAESLVPKSSNEDLGKVSWNMDPVKETDYSGVVSDQKKNGRSKTLSFEPSQSERESKLISKLSSFSSKTKPIAPKLKSAVTIGVASGVEALKAINIINNSSHTSKPAEKSNIEYSANRKLLHDIRRLQKSEQEKADEQTKTDCEKNSRETRPSITRIISSESLPKYDQSTKNYSNK